MFAKDLTGMRFGKLTVLYRVENSAAGRVRWLCKCDCGNKRRVQTSNLLSGSTTSCGCRQHLGNPKHGMAHERIYVAWKNMKTRCANPNNQYFEDYGGRGITVCEEWQKFEPFYEWAMNNGYSDDLTIERIDNDDGYYPDNCKWATREEQTRNRRSTRSISYDGKTLTVMEWSKLTGIPYRVLTDRIYRYNWSVERALTTPVKGYREE